MEIERLFEGLRGRKEQAKLCSLGTKEPPHINKNVLLCPLKCLILKKKLQNVYVFHYNLVLNVCCIVKFLKNTLENIN